MDTLLILLGLLLILAGYAWLIMQAFSRSLFWGLASLVPPLALVFMLRHWIQARRAVVLGGLGCIPLVVGLTLLAVHDSARLEAILRLDWLRPEPDVKPELAIQLRGELNGKPFAPEQADLIDGTLSLREGQDFYAHREVRIRLPAPVAADEPLRLDVLPNDSGILPEVEISWLAPGQDLPEAIRFARGYSLHLDLQPEAPNRMVGVFHLVLPAQMRTTLSGQIELYTNHLRYRDGQVDTRVDSQDTLTYVVRDYLQRRFARRDVELAQLPRLDTLRPVVNVPVSFSLGGEPQTLSLILAKSEARGWGVKGDKYPLLVDSPAPVQVSTQPVEAAAEQTPAAPEAGLIPLQRLQAAPERFANRHMRVLTEQGRTAEGVFIGLDTDGRLVIRHSLSGAGEASYVLRPSEVVSIELLAN